MSSEYGLHRVSSLELKRLLRALHRGALSSPITRASLIEKAFGDQEAHLDLLVGRDDASAKALVLAVLAERGVEQRSTASLSYSGVPAPGTRSRDLAEQTRELLASATKSAQLYGVRMADVRTLARTLSALRGGRDVAIRLVLEEPLSDTDREDLPKLLGTRGGALEVYVARGARLRARLVIIDELRVLVTSGWLAGGEEDGFVDAGVLISDGDYVRAWDEEWQRLVATGACEPVD